MGINEILNELRQLADSNREQGDLFERVIANYLRESPLYRDRIAEAWQWGEWANRKGIDQTDVGIDLVVHTHENEYWAVQCKCYAEAHYLQKTDIDSFLSTAGQSWGGVRFSLCLIIATTPRWSKHAEEALERRQPPCIRLGLTELAADEGVNWSTLLSGIRHGIKKPARRKLKPHQREAVNDVYAGFQKSDRGQLIMACGTGKTFTALKIAEKQIEAGGRVLFLVPSLALLSQTLREWSAHHEWEFMRSFAVCSDSKVGRDNEDISAYDLVIPPTTDGKQLVKGLEVPLPEGQKRAVQVVFATYHSIGVVHTAQKFGAKEFDLVICDEAHRTTGVELQGEEASYYIRVHDNNYLRAGKRLYMTATPRIYSETARQRAREQDVEVFSMDDAAKYGIEFHRLDFSNAVAKDLLSDYKVLILAINEAHASRAVQGLLATNGEVNLDDAAKIIGCWNGLSKRIDEAEAAGITDLTPMRRAVAFTQSIKASKQVAGHFSAIVEEYRQGNPDDITALECEIKHVDGTQNALIRNQALQWLRDEPEDNSCHILSNVRCLSEGVDVPALDAVMFLNPRRSQVDVVQSVGRVMRKAEGKDYGYIILPICVDADSAPEDALNKNEKYQVVWRVLQALRAHDNRFNAEINKIELNKQPSKRINVIGVGFGSGPEQNTVDDIESRPYLQSQISIPLALEEWKNALLARIVLKCGDRRYWENWAKDVADIAGRNITRINTLVASSEAGYRELFEEFMIELRQNLNPAVTEEDAVEMLAQHLITRPVFDALFENYSFIGNNPVSKTMQAMLELLDEKKLETEASSLEGFYESVRQRASGIDNAEGRQKVIIELYEKFFKTAFPKMAESLGIVYTPVEVVDFILDSTDALLKQEFGKGLTAENVHILDPFTGTGTFMTRLLRSQYLVGDEDLERKYRKELHANEIVLLAYYIAAVNIEETYHDRLAGKRRQMRQDDTADYEPFEGIVLTDTFQINERDGDMLEQIFPVNSKRVLRQKDTPIWVVMGNPPYSAGQRSANDNNANLRYPRLDENISGSYARYSRSMNKNSLYDSYIRAFRWASDRVGEEGIVAYVSNGGWLDGNAMDGFRRCLADEFSSIYCFNLRGNARTSGEQRRREKDNVFGQGTRTNITILVLVKNPLHKGDCQLRYYDIGDYLNRKQKLETIKEFGNVKKMDWRTITPNAHHDWINQRDEAFLNYLPLGDNANRKKLGSMPSVFTLFGRGVETCRDAWVYNFSKDALFKNMQSTIAFYNSEVERYQNACKGKNDDEKPEVDDFINNDSTRISWSSSLTAHLKRMTKDLYDPDHARKAVYRPFNKQHLYFNNIFIHRLAIANRFFPSSAINNKTICVSGIGANKEFSAFMVDMMPDLEVVSKSQCFPRYRYTSAQAQRRQATLDLTEAELQRQDNIPAGTVSGYQSHYRNKEIDADSIFYYVYGILHSSDFKTRFAADLKKMLPRIPYASSITDFQSFSEAGRQLAELHVGYEDVEPWPVVIQEDIAGIDGKDHFQVRKMRFGGSARQPDKSVIRYNPHITIEGIPLTAYDYVVNGKSAIEWVMERYQYTTHKDSGITNDPNDWSDDPRYILNLLQKVVRVSMDTVKIVNSLPGLDSVTDSSLKEGVTGA
ncbi:MAG: DEAD/DEAH box helicase family protein [Gammaproteobacteria bacterium]|nr:DEAD/DEAH box helicase family protein [Gammaproteobacteria bacterium]